MPDGHSTDRPITHMHDHSSHSNLSHSIEERPGVTYPFFRFLRRLIVPLTLAILHRSMSVCSRRNETGRCVTYSETEVLTGAGTERREEIGRRAETHRSGRRSQRKTIVHDAHAVREATKATATNDDINWRRCIKCNVRQSVYASRAQPSDPNDPILIPRMRAMIKKLPPMKDSSTSFIRF